MVKRKPRRKETGRCRSYITDFGFKVRCFKRAGHKGPHAYNPWR